MRATVYEKNIVPKYGSSNIDICPRIYNGFLVWNDICVEVLVRGSWPVKVGFWTMDDKTIEYDTIGIWGKYMVFLGYVWKYESLVETL